MPGVIVLEQVGHQLEAVERGRIGNPQRLTDEQHAKEILLLLALTSLMRRR